MTHGRPKQSRPWVVKIGGRLCDDPSLRRAFVDACDAVDQPLVIVHGGGAQVTRLQEQLGSAPRFVDGKRVTAAEDVRIVEMALSAEVGKSLVRDLLAAGRSAVGLSGVDGGLITCTLVPALGAVGIPARVDAAFLRRLLATGVTVALSPISLGPTGEAVNVNADDVACAVAAALGAEALLLVSDVPGVRVAGQVAAALEPGQVEALISAGEIQGGMIPKLRAASAALAAGVGEVRITGLGEGPLPVWQGTTLRHPTQRAPQTVEVHHD